MQHPESASGRRSFAACLAMAAFALGAPWASTGCSGGDEAQAGADADQTGRASFQCTVDGNPCVVDRPGDLGTYCYRKVLIDQTASGVAQVRVVADHGAAGIGIATQVAQTETFRASATAMFAAWSAWGTHYQLDVSASGGAGLTGTGLIHPGHPFAMTCARTTAGGNGGSGSGNGNGRTLGQTCKAPTSNPSMRCAGGLTCDTRGADHIEADGVCR